MGCSGTLEPVACHSLLARTVPWAHLSLCMSDRPCCMFMCAPRPRLQVAIGRARLEDSNSEAASLNQRLAMERSRCECCSGVPVTHCSPL